DRRALLAHLVRADLSPRLQERAQLRRLVDRVGQHGAGADREAVVDRETRIAWLVDHYRRPRHKGALVDADAHVPGGNPGCGDVITMYVKAEHGAEEHGAGRLSAISWEGVGCT